MMNLKILRFIVVLMHFLATTNVMALENNNAPKKIIEFTQNILIKFADNPVIIQSVLTQNAKNIPLQDIKKLDQAWISTPGINRFMMDLRSNECALELLTLEDKYKFIVRSFVMDNQGALVGTTRKNSDYWQGDEAKFTESYKNGKGAVYYDKITYEGNSEETVIEISVPVKNNEMTIGVVAFTLDLDSWESR